MNFIATSLMLLGVLAFSQPEATNYPLVSSTTSLIRDATFMERSPSFTDLYLIQTPNKGRSILIYCTSSHCYRQRNLQLVV